VARQVVGLNSTYFLFHSSMKSLSIVFPPTCSELLRIRLSDSRPPTSAASGVLHDCRMRSSWLRSHLKYFARDYEANPERFKLILLEMNYICMSCSPFHAPSFTYPRRLPKQHVYQMAAQRDIGQRQPAQRVIGQRQPAQRVIGQRQPAQRDAACN